VACATLDCFRRRPLGYGGHVASLAVTATWILVLAAECARALHDVTLFKNERAQGRPGADRTHGPRATKSTRQNHRYEPNIRPPLRNGFNSLYVISPGTGSLAPVVHALVARRLGISTGMPGPHDFAVRIALFVRMIRSRCSSIRPSHPALHVRDDRDTPLCTRRDVTKIADFQKKCKKNICSMILNSSMHLKRHAKIVSTRMSLEPSCESI
jgi:hypothetical protein